MISIERLRAELQLPASEDEKLTQYRDTVVDRWETETGLKWRATDSIDDYVQTIRNKEESAYTLDLDHALVTEIVLVEVKELRDDSWTALDANDTLLIPRRSLERIDGEIWSPLVRVRYAGGYAEDTVGSDILQALIVQTQFHAQRFQTSAVAISSQNFEGGSGQYLAPDLHPLFAALAKRYKAR